MPKIRAIHPQTWTDENFVDLTPLARLLFIGLWNYACDNGHLEDRSKQLKMRLLPADDCNVADLLRELDEKGRITRAEGWITVPTLGRHQKIDKRWFTTCDKPGCVKSDADKKPETANPEPETRRGPTVAPSSPHRDPGVDKTSLVADVDVDVDCDVDSDGDGDLTTPPTAALAVAPTRPDVDRICQHLADRIERNGAKRPEIGKRWHDAARLMLDNDGRTEADIHAAIDWCQDDEFWRANILSLPKLREKYDQLRLQAQRRAGPRSRQQETNDIFERAAVRLGIVPGGQA